ncbi:serine/arginine-rich SC35-like splicing factor SCL33 [Artemisia annua]|uniref:Serine/arginine-rich SC35-like splicing factor SCL33 n=1 Tax=Artemisia annua TaxID=35608 RepID=A0A2U1P085_ARTAN|nr:serine/arginine-rich SC35-like splicing factor SCL33 [Artemisia annua]
MRGRSYSYSPSPTRYRSRTYRSRSPRRRDRYRDLPTSLLVRNLGRGCSHFIIIGLKSLGVKKLLNSVTCVAICMYEVDLKNNVKKVTLVTVGPEDLRGPFGEFGPLKDVYLPRDYYTGEPRGFGFVQYLDPDDAAEAKYHMDGQILLGRELTVVFAEENRKKPSEMRARERSRSVLCMNVCQCSVVSSLSTTRFDYTNGSIWLCILQQVRLKGDSHMIVEDLPSVILVLLVVEDLTVAVQVTILLLLGGTAAIGPSHPENEGTEKGHTQGVHIVAVSVGNSLIIFMLGFTKVQPRVASSAKEKKSS